MTGDDLQSFTIGIDLASGPDETAVCLRVGKEIHIIPEPFASALAEHLSRPTPPRVDALASEEAIKEFSLDYWNSQPQIFGPGFKNIQDLAVKVVQKFCASPSSGETLAGLLERVPENAGWSLRCSDNGVKKSSEFHYHDRNDVRNGAYNVFSGYGETPTEAIKSALDAAGLGL